MKIRRLIPSGRFVRKVFAWASVFVIMGCAGGELDPDEFLSFFQPETSTVNPLHIHYHFSPDFVYHRDKEYYLGGWKSRDDSTAAFDDNVLAWRSYCDNAVEPAAIDKLLSSKFGDIASSLEAGRSASSIPDSLEMLKYLTINRKSAAIEYLRFALRVNQANDFAETPSFHHTDGSHHSKGMRPVAAAPDFLDTAIARANATSDPYLHPRYAFQAIKLAGQRSSYPMVIKLFDQYFGKDTSENVMKYWSLSRLAGAHYWLGDSARAIYEFAQVFDHSDSKKYPAYLSMRIRGYQFVPEALQYCKSPRERAAVYALAAIQPYVATIGMLEKIVDENPQSSMLELVMAREINKTEYAYFNQNDNYYYLGADTIRNPPTADSSLDYFDKLRLFAQQRTTDSRITDKAFWFTALAYLDYVRKDYPQAEQHLNTASAAPTANHFITDQIAMQRLTLAIAEQKEMTREFEQKIVPMLKPFNNADWRISNVYSTSCRAIADLYRAHPPKLIKAGLSCGVSSTGSNEVEAPIAKAYLFSLMATNNYAAGASLPTPQMEDSASAIVLDSTIAYLRRANSDLDRTIIALAGRPVGTFYALRGRRAILDQDYATAIAALRNVPDSTWKKEPYVTYLAANPFWTGIIETHVKVEADSVRYTPLKFAERMVALQKDASSSDPATSANANYLLGVGLLNLTAEGNSWLIVSRSWSPAYSGRYFATEPIDLSDSSLVNLAYDRFKRALSLEPDHERAARDVWMAARCEVGEYYAYLDERWAKQKTIEPSLERYGNSGRYDSLDYRFRLDAHKLHRNNFALLKSKFSDTQYAKEVIKECSYYRDFVAGMP